MSLETIALDAGGGARVVVAPALQGRVLSSEAPGAGATAFVDAREIEAGESDRPFCNFGGQDRAWLGPEGGRFGLFFPPGAPIGGAHWRVPPALNRGAFEVTARGAARVAMRRTIDLENRAGARFRIALDRVVEIADAAASLGVAIPAGVRAVGSRTTTTMTNAGGARWREEEGLPFLWILGQFPAGPRAEVIAPFRDVAAARREPTHTDGYFGEAPPDRAWIDGRAVRMRADGACVTKIGLSAARSTGRAGAIDPDRRMLTIVAFDHPPRGARVPSNLWPIDAPAPFGGDVFQTFNSGGEPRFFELESASCARALAPGESLAHRHATFFFYGGDAGALDGLARAALGLDAPIAPRHESGSSA